MTLHRRDLISSMLLSACACGLARFAGAQALKKKQSVPPLEKWKVSDPPRVGSDEWYAYNNNVRVTYQVASRDGQITAYLIDDREWGKVRLPFEFVPGRIGQEPKTQPGTSLYDKKRAVRVSDGWLIFINHGEWGGRVNWFSADGTTQYKVSRDQVAAYAQTPEGLFAVQGLAHLGMSYGTFLRFEQTSAGKWEAQKLLDLKDAPYVLLPEQKDTFLIVTREKLVRVRPADKVATLLVKADFWGGLYPNSLVAAPNGDFYLGMRGGVVRLEKTNQTYAVRWLTPPA